jgi:hypothetical protein
MFVPSLSWQSDRFSVAIDRNMAQKKAFFPAPAALTLLIQSFVALTFRPYTASRVTNWVGPKPDALASASTFRWHKTHAQHLSKRFRE